MQARVVRVRDLTPDDEAAWSALAARAVEPNPFFEPEMIIPAADLLSHGHEIELAIASEGNRFTAVIPLRETTRYSFPYPFVTTQVRRTVESGTPLLDPDNGAEGFAEILDLLASRKSLLHSRILAMRKVTQEAPSYPLLEKAARLAGMPLIVTESFKRGFLYRRPEESYEDHYNSKFRSRLRRRRKRLAEHFGRSGELVDHTLDPYAAKRYVDLELSGYKGATGIAITESGGEAEFFLESCRRFTAQRRARIFAFEANDVTLAMGIWFLSGPGFFGFKTSYDQNFSHYAPGVMLQLAEVGYFHSQTDAQWMDTCAQSGNELLLELYPDRRQTALVMIPLGKNVVDLAAIRSFLSIRPAHKWWHDKRHQKRVYHL